MFPTLVIKGRDSRLTTALVAVVVLLKLIVYLYLSDMIRALEDRKYSYLGNDHPRLWPIRTGQAVKMRFEDSVRFVFDNGEVGARIWESQIPGNGIIYLGPHKQPYSIGMFHELKCLSHLRTQIILAKGLRENNETYVPTRLSRHCLNYLRQMVLCRADVDLEPISMLPPGAHAYEYRCNDWTSVYDAVSQNQREYAKRAGEPRLRNFDFLG